MESEAKTVIFSGNLRQCAAYTSQAWNLANTTSELLSALEASFVNWKASNPQTSIASVTEVHGKPCRKHNTVSEDRTQVKVTVKLVLLDANPVSVEEALSSVCKTLSVQWVDLVILSLNQPAPDSADSPSTTSAGSPVTGSPLGSPTSSVAGSSSLMASPTHNHSHSHNHNHNHQSSSSPLSTLERLPTNYLPAWRGLEAAHASGRALALGVCDLTAPQLTELLTDAVVKPVVNQVAFTHPCSCKDEAVIKAAASLGIELMTHSDASVLVPVADVETLVTRQTELALTPRWVARYSVTDETRSVITNYGFVYGLAASAGTGVNTTSANTSVATMEIAGRSFINTAATTTTAATAAVVVAADGRLSAMV